MDCSHLGRYTTWAQRWNGLLCCRLLLRTPSRTLLSCIPWWQSLRWIRQERKSHLAKFHSQRPPLGRMNLELRWIDSSISLNSSASTCNLLHAFKMCTAKQVCIPTHVKTQVSFFTVPYIEEMHSQKNHHWLYHQHIKIIDPKFLSYFQKLVVYKTENGSRERKCLPRTNKHM